MRSIIDEYTGLTGVRGNLKGPRSKSISGIIRALDRYRVTSDAGDHGAITAWVDDAGRMRAAFTRWRATVSEEEFRSRRALKACWSHGFPR
jgi:hypothetical protein